MKWLISVSAVLFSSLAMAAQQNNQIQCFNHSDSDYELILITNSAGMPIKAALNNMDWGTAGTGAFQVLLTEGEFGDGVFSDFLIDSQVEPTMGLESGALLHISYSADNIVGATLTPENAKEVGVQFDSYTCAQ